MKITVHNLIWKLHFGAKPSQGIDKSHKTLLPTNYFSYKITFWAEKEFIFRMYVVGGGYGL
jgi:hypothetical protein